VLCRGGRANREPRLALTKSNSRAFAVAGPHVRGWEGARDARRQAVLYSQCASVRSELGIP
jgi:hypothetical protein